MIWLTKLWSWLPLGLVVMMAIISIKADLIRKEYQAKNDFLMQQLEQKESETESMAIRIDDLQSQKQHDQYRIDEWLKEETIRTEELNSKVEKLTQELSNAACHSELIVYPDGWVSGYESDNKNPVQGSDKLSSVDGAD